MFGAVDYVVGERLFSAGQVAEQHVAGDTELLEQVDATADLHGGRSHADQ